MGSLDCSVSFRSVFAFCVALLTFQKNHYAHAKGIGVNPGPAVLATHGQVWPKPQNQLRHDNFVIVLPSEFKFEVVNNTCEILEEAIKRYSKILQSQEKRRRLAKKMNAESRRRDVTASDKYSGALQKLQINLFSACEALPHFQMDEKYELRVASPDMGNSAVLMSASIWGILRGLETFSQLMYVDDSGALIINGTSIMDFPRFPHRGLLLDTSRHYMPLRIIQKTLDAMSMNKFNVFHWHIVDDQSFPYESLTFPHLSKYGAYSPKHVYHPNDVRDVINYATLRGIRVVPEFDTPGHTRSWGQGHPELLTTCYNKKQQPDGTLGPMNPIVEKVYDFLGALLTEIGSVFPDNFFHLGGDEVNYSCWMSNPEIQKYVKENQLSYPKLEEMFVKKVLDMAHARSFHTVVWQEVFDNGLRIPKNTTIHVWKTTEYMYKVERATAQGYPVLLSSPWYLDHIAGGGDWKKYYNVDPHNFNGSPEQKRRVIGGEACMWSESVDSTNVMQRVWPRASAAAERLWSSEQTTNQENAESRLEEHTCRMNMRGIPAQPPNGPGVCPYVNF